MSGDVRRRRRCTVDNPLGGDRRRRLDNGSVARLSSASVVGERVPAVALLPSPAAFADGVWRPRARSLAATDFLMDRAVAAARAMERAALATAAAVDLEGVSIATGGGESSASVCCMGRLGASLAAA